MRSLVLGALLAAAAAWLLTGSDPSLPVAATTANVPAPRPPEAQVAPVAAGEAGRAGDPTASAAAARLRVVPPVPVSPRMVEADDVPGAEFVVVDEAGRPLELARVQAFAGERDFTAAWTDERGIATLRGAPPGAQHRVRAEGYWPYVGDGCVASTTTRVVMRRAALLSGAVFDAAGAPVAGANAYLLPVVAGRLCVIEQPGWMLSPDLQPWTAVTDNGGRFEGRWPDEDPHDLVVVAKGFAQAVVPALSFAKQGEAPVIVRLQPAAVVAGVALRADGVPLVNAMIRVSTVRAGAQTGLAALGPPSLGADQSLAHAVTTARGEFAVGDLPAGPVVVTLADAHAAAGVVTTLIAGRTTQVQLRAEPNASVDGEVQGALLAPVKVFLYGGRGVLHQGATAGGKFAFDDVPPGRYLAGAVRDDFAEHVAAIVQDYLVNGATSLATTVELAAGERRHVVLPHPVPANGGVTGTASVGGAPASGCVVWLEPLGGPRTHRREGIVDAAGEFRIDGVPPGDYDAHLHRIGDPKVLVEARCRVRAGDTLPITLAAP